MFLRGYFVQRLFGYLGVDCRPSNDLPFTSAALLRFVGGDEPPELRQKLGRLDCVFPVETEGTGGELIDLARGHGRPIPSQL
jgi:hypothetical protein